MFAKWLCHNSLCTQSDISSRRHFSEFENLIVRGSGNECGGGGGGGESFGDSGGELAVEIAVTWLANNLHDVFSTVSANITSKHKHTAGIAGGENTSRTACHKYKARELRMASRVEILLCRSIVNEESRRIPRKNLHSITRRIIETRRKRRTR